jgi:predicted metal-binding membrane protein
MARHKPVVPAGMLAGGYVTVWLGFSFVATLAQAGLRAAGALDVRQGSVSAVLAGFILMLAGAYQFTPLKQACLSKCQRPMPFFLANWTHAPGGVFRLGLRQGLWCLGCCWALMLVMFAAGLMNLAWMAGLGLVMMAEKLYADSRALTWGAGLIFLAGGAAVLAIGLNQ